jgi:Holliday junction DNA helicase RuvA
MIAYLEGQILRSEASLIVLKTSGGVGYAVHVTKQLSVKATSEEFLTLHIYTNVREDDLSLYGFQNIEEKELFTMLIKTSGVGPKLGLAVLSVLSPRQLVDAVLQNSTESFSQVPGIGKKTAAKLCLDLKDQLKRHPIIEIES